MLMNTELPIMMYATNPFNHTFRVLLSTLFVLYVHTNSFSATIQHPRTAQDILDECYHMYDQLLHINHVDKQLLCVQAQSEADLLYATSYSPYNIEWQTYYIHLVQVVLYMDPSKSMDAYRKYMEALKKLVKAFPPRYAELRWYAYRKLNQLYILDDKPEKAYKLLENMVKELQIKPYLSHRDSTSLEMAMIGQLYSGSALPCAIGVRNLRYLNKHSDRELLAMGKALFQGNHHKVITLCDTYLQRKTPHFLERFYLSKVMWETLQKVPVSRYNAKRMLQLLALQDSLYHDVKYAQNIDYSAYKEFQKESYIKAQLDRKSRIQYFYITRIGIALAIVALALIILLWYTNRYKLKMKRSLIDQLHTEKQAQSLALESAQQAYLEQRALVRNLNHDLRTPLNALIGFSHILSSDESLTAEELHEAGQNIRKSSALLLDMINNLLAVARVETKKMSLEKRVFSSDELLSQDAWQDCINHLPASHTLSFAAIQDAPVTMYTDDRHVHKITQLVVSYIIQSTLSGRIELQHRVDLVKNQYVITIRTQRQSSVLADIEHALDTRCTMSDYDDALHYSLVLARMLAQLIDSRLELDTHDSKYTSIVLSIPLTDVDQPVP